MPKIPGWDKKADKYAQQSWFNREGVEVRVIPDRGSLWKVVILDSDGNLLWRKKQYVSRSAATKAAVAYIREHPGGVRS